jgi:hypothetical protein
MSSSPPIIVTLPSDWELYESTIFWIASPRPEYSFQVILKESAPAAWVLPGEVTSVWAVSDVSPLHAASMENDRSKDITAASFLWFLLAIALSSVHESAPLSGNKNYLAVIKIFYLLIQLYYAAHEKSKSYIVSEVLQ